jgi:hypothetical protein
MNVIVTYQEILFATARQDIMTDQADQRDADWNNLCVNVCYCAAFQTWDSILQLESSTEWSCRHRFHQPMNNKRKISIALKQESLFENLQYRF